MLAGVALTEKTHALSSTLSGGQMRKCCLAIALIGESPALVLDEPTSGVCCVHVVRVRACVRARVCGRVGVWACGRL